ncbi:LPXTG-domain-containing protein [Colletotrichum abscissum]|uniref:LPXTG-domain-containing protein n=1 Tax=Colletotrichum abscissum TaxID=1671311 RepID=UPI0027D6F2DD|nr:LPXTG-domain-containing protein [Colletotrichum abscissum]KAK1484402.1 LPXTG-domain-containing protein [Colletotrichum abscissum]
MAKADLVEMQQQKGGYDAVNTTSSPGNTDDGAKNNHHHESGAYPYATDGGTGDSTLRRLFSFWQLLAFALIFMSSWEVMAMDMGATFYNGGPQTLAWGIVLVVVGAMAQALSMAELATIQPIAGAQYHWTHFLAPEKHRRFITWMQGWVTWFAWVSALAGSAASEANIMIGLVSTNYPSYTFQPWHITMVIIAQLVACALINMYAFRTIPWMELLAGVLHVVLWLVFVVVLLTLAPRASAEFVFFERTVSSGWTNGFVSWNIGMLVPAWGFIGFDGVVHMAEETKKAKQAVPRAMLWTIILNGVLSYGIILAILFGMGGDPATTEAILSSDYPIIPLLFNAAGPAAGTAMVVGLLVITFCVVAASLASVSRITWAWARDGGLPRYFAKIHPTHRVPIRSVWLPCVIVTCLSLFTVGNNATATVFSAFTALSSLGLYGSYIIAISCMLHARLTGRIGHGAGYQVQYGGWSLPRGWGTPINVYALLWSMYLSVWLPFPQTIPVTGTEMNYAGPIYVVVVVGAVSLWFTWGKKHWPGLNKSAIDNVVAYN